MMVNSYYTGNVCELKARIFLFVDLREFFFRFRVGGGGGGGGGLGGGDEEK